MLIPAYFPGGGDPRTIHLLRISGAGCRHIR
jgi:hypothetical protein